ncbi:MAG: histidine--tRNA ligase [Ignavibacteriales bacterium]
MIKTIYGTKDILPDSVTKWQFVENLVRDVMRNFNYKEIRTPIFEETALFKRGIGESTDIVSKEMYTFLDRSETSITLKPEMTACVVRSVLEHSLDKQNPLNKLYYISPMFRQERPQAGRLRQFHQFGAEAIGVSSPILDAEMIVIAYSILKKIGLKNLVVKINSLGIPSTRENYKNVLREFLVDKVSRLSEDSKKRFETNILRIFDSKDERDQEILLNAPLLLEHLDDSSLEKFEIVKKILLDSEIPFEIDSKLVRGLDYYTETTFEIISGSVGSQSALCGGGRYDLLAEQIGDRNIPGVGFAAGIERILLACENENINLDEDAAVEIYVARIDRELTNEAYKISGKLRDAGVSVELDYAGRSVKAQMREANKMNAQYVLFVGGDEYKRNELLLKKMSDGSQQTINIDSLSSITNIIRG